MRKELVDRRGAAIRLVASAASSRGPFSPSLPLAVSPAVTPPPPPPPSCPPKPRARARRRTLSTSASLRDWHSCRHCGEVVGICGSSLPPLFLSRLGRPRRLAETRHLCRVCVPRRVSGPGSWTPVLANTTFVFLSMVGGLVLRCALVVPLCFYFVVCRLSLVVSRRPTVGPRRL